MLISKLSLWKSLFQKHRLSKGNTQLILFNNLFLLLFSTQWDLQHSNGQDFTENFYHQCYLRLKIAISLLRSKAITSYPQAVIKKIKQSKNKNTLRDIMKILMMFLTTFKKQRKISPIQSFVALIIPMFNYTTIPLTFLRAWDVDLWTTGLW